MNTNPDEITLARWLDDELSGTELAEMEAWAANNPEQIQAREELRKYRSVLKNSISANEEPPYPDFFLSRVRQGIRDLEQGAAQVPAHAAKTSFAKFWSNWMLPVAACAGVVLAFAIGRQTGGSEAPIVQKAIAPVLYTPEEGVAAEWVTAEKGQNAVIVLEGVTAIPDSTDFSATVYVPTARESDRTATLESKESSSENQ